MNSEYNREEMIEWLKQYFIDLGFEVDRYSDKFYPARVPLHCEKEEDDKIDEIVVEITTNRIILKDEFFPLLSIGKVEIMEASSVRFFQYYFPKAKIFYAYPDYVQESDDFNQFKDVCKKRGIGLLKTSKIKIEEVVESHTLFDQIYTKILKRKNNEEIKTIISEHLENYLHYLVYYPDPVYKRRSLTLRMEKDKDKYREKDKISFVLIDKLSELNNICYKEELKKLSSEYREKAQDEYDIAEDFIFSLWDKYLGLKYPNIHRRVENILQRNDIYREHFVHQFQVFLIGSYILDKIYPETAGKFEKKYKCKIENVWLAASTFHDFSYGLQNFDIWLLQFFEDTLRIKSNQTKENLNLLNLDAAMIREELFDKIIEIVNQLSNKWEEKTKRNMTIFFYEKVVNDRNHGILSAISLLKLYDDNDEKKRKINNKGISRAALAIGCHDEDIWEILCGCQGYCRSPDKPEEIECNKMCIRESLLWPSKRSRIYREKVSNNTTKENIDKFCCESWEGKIARERTIDKIRFTNHPILFLLIFCDNIQDEGRVTSSDKHYHGDRSTLDNIMIDKENGETIINIKLKSEKIKEKNKEVERMAWCLEDNRFRISINDKLKMMNGSGGG